MTFLDISQSSYIFTQQIILGIIAIVACIGLTTFLLFRLKKSLKNTHSRLQEFGQTILATLAIWTIYFTCLLQILTKTFSLQNNGVEIIGKTIERDYTDGSQTIKYSFVINGMTFTGVCDVVYYGQEIPGIKCPDGNYIVIYDYEDPTNSVMDFKRPAR